MRPERTRELLDSLENSDRPFNTDTISTVVNEQPQSILDTIGQLFGSGGPKMISSIPTAMFKLTAEQQQKLGLAQANQGLQQSIANLIAGSGNNFAPHTITNLFTTIFNWIT